MSTTFTLFTCEARLLERLYENADVYDVFTRMENLLMEKTFAQ
jgi:hypothetical protein